jgi:ribosomal protein S18 acetylase RimI-like enzyme
MHIALRPAKQQDAEFAYTVEEDAMRTYAERTWGHWKPAADPSAHIAAFSPDGHSVVLAHQQPVGILTVERHPEHLFLAQLYLLAAHRGRGIGSHLLRSVLAEGRAERKPVKLRVLEVNTRAQAFYARHGFTVERTEDHRVYMVSPAA